MDLSTPTITALTPPLSKRATFLATFRCQQEWPFPDSLIYYITKNPSSPKAYKKIIQSCKYFFIKNPILIKNHTGNIFKTVAAKIWITEVLDLCNIDLHKLSSAISNIYQCDIWKLVLFDQNIYFNDLKFIASKAEEIIFGRVNVMTKNDGGIVVLETIIEILPNLKDFVYNFGENGSNIITSTTVAELLKLPHFSNLRSLSLIKIPEAFDMDCFYEFLKENKTTKIYLEFCNQISDGYKSHLHGIVDLIICDGSHAEYKPPLINFPGITDSSFKKLYHLYNWVPEAPKRGPRYYRRHQPKTMPPMAPTSGMPL